MVFKFFEARIGGEIKGKGKDVVGLFVIRGFADAAGKAQFTKTYIGKHTVLYNGMLAGNTLNGTWHVAGLVGGFQITRIPKKWTGWYKQDGERTDVNFDHMNIYRGTIKGKGVDVVGDFTINGEVRQNGEVSFSKQYVGGHLVQYDGTLTYREIKGRWSMPAFGVSDEFYIQKNYEDGELSDIE